MHKQRQGSADQAMESSLVGALRFAVDLSIAGVLLVAPLAMGGRYPLGRFVLLGLVSVAAVSWCLQCSLSRKPASWTWSGAELIWAPALLLVVLQLMPLSPEWLQRLSPHAGELLPQWTSADTTAIYTWPTWDRVSLSPQATRGGLAMLLAYIMLFSIVVQRIRHKQEIERMLQCVAVAGIGMAAIGLLQYFVSNGKFLWFYEHPSRDTWTAVKGTFANENHFAHFLALTIGPVIWWLVKLQATEATEDQFKFNTAHRKAKGLKSQIVLSLGLGLILLAGMLTYSRGGIAMIFLATMVSMAVFAMQGKVGRRSVIAMAAIVLVSAVAVWIHGQELLLREIETIQSVDIESLDQGRSRRKIWSAVTNAIPDFAYLGSGIGSHRDIYPTYFNEPSAVEYSHAESGYLQVLLEAGGPGFALLLCGIVLSGYWILRALLAKKTAYQATLAVPVGAAWCVSVVHAVADFNWYIPANMSVMLVLLALALRLSQLVSGHSRRKQRLPVARSGWAVATCVIVWISALGLQHFFGPARAAKHWDEYLAWSLATNRFESKSIGPGRQRRLGLVDGSSPDSVAWMTDQLEKAVAYDPLDARVNIRLAAMYLRQFEIRQASSDNAMSLSQIRDAAFASNFPSRDEMSNWVSKAVGDNRALLDRAILHAKQGVQLGPLQGRGYMYLGEVAFLDDKHQINQYELLRQAYAVRPFDPSIQFVFGRQKLLSGDVEGALVLWKEAFRRGPSVRKRIIDAIAPQVSPTDIMAIFQPGLSGLKDLFDYYRRRVEAEQVKQVGEKYISELEQQASLLSGDLAAQLWFDAQFAYHVLGKPMDAADAAVRCVKEQPNAYQNHFACALRLREAGGLQSALDEFRWCQSRRPDDPNLPRVIAGLYRQLRQSPVMRPVASHDQPRR